MTKRWKQRPAGLDLGRLGRRRRARPHQPAHPREGAPGRARGRGRHQLLPQPAARLPRRHRAEPAALPAGVPPTEDMDGNPDVFYNVHMSEMREVRRPRARRRVGRRRGDALAAVLDAVGLARARRRRVRRRRRRRRGGRLLQRLPRRAPTSSARSRTRAGDGSDHRRVRAPPRPRAHGRPRRAGPRRARRPRPPPRPRLARRRPRDARGDHGGRRRRRGAGRHAAAPHRLRDRRSSSGTATRTPCRSTRCARTSTRDDESLLEWIADSQISALVADNYAVEGLVGGKRPEGRHSLLPIHHLCLFKLGVPLGELWYLHELAAWLREHDRSRFLLTAPPLRLPGRRRLSPDAGRDRLTPLGSPTGRRRVRVRAGTRRRRADRGTRPTGAGWRGTSGSTLLRIGAVVQQLAHDLELDRATGREVERRPTAWSVTVARAMQTDHEVPAAVRRPRDRRASAGGGV